MGNINFILAIDIIVILLGFYVLYLAIRMKATRTINKLIIPEEDLKKCKNPQELADYLAGRMLFFAGVIIVCGGVLLVDEVIYDLGIGIYISTAILLISYVIFYKQLGDAKSKYC